MLFITCICRMLYDSLMFTIFGPKPSLPIDNSVKSNYSFFFAVFQKSSWALSICNMLLVSSNASSKYVNSDVNNAWDFWRCNSRLVLSSDATSPGFMKAIILGATNGTETVLSFFLVQAIEICREDHSLTIYKPLELCMSWRKGTDWNPNICHTVGKLRDPSTILFTTSYFISIWTTWIVRTWVFLLPTCL